METVSALTDQPIEETLAGKKHKFRRLTLAELFGRFEAEVKNDWRTRIYEIASGLKGDDKFEYLSHQAARPLSSGRSTELVKDKMNSGVGVMLILSLAHLVEDKTDTLPEAITLLAEKVDQEVVKGLIAELTGTAGVKMEGGADVDPKA